MPNYYDVLHVPRDASPELIKEAYRAQAKVWHPDRKMSHDAEDRFKEISVAYETLRDPARRDEYDSRLDAGLGAGGAPESGETSTDDSYEEPEAFNIQVSPRTIDFGRLTAGGSSVEAEITLTWDGGAPQHIRPDPRGGDWWDFKFDEIRREGNSVIFPVMAQAHDGLSPGRHSSHVDIVVDGVAHRVELVMTIVAAPGNPVSGSAPGSVGGTPPPGVPPDPAPRQPRSLLRALVAGVTVLAAVSGATAWFLNRPTPAWVPGTGTAYVTNGSGIVPVNLATGQVGSPIAVAGTPYGIALSPQDGTAYVIDQTTCQNCTGTVGISSLLPVNLSTGTTGDATAIAEGTTGSGNEAFQVVLSEDGTTAYVMSGSGIVPVDLATRSKGSTIKAGSAVGQIAISPDGSTLYVTTGGNEDLAAVSAATGKIDADVKLGHAILAMAVAPGGGTVYVYDAGGIASVNPAEGRINWQISSPELGDGGPTGASLVVLPDGQTAYAAGGGTGVVPINLRTHQAGQLIRLNDSVSTMAASPNGKAVYVGGWSGKIYPVNTATNQVGKPVSTGSDLQFMAIAP